VNQASAKDLTKTIDGLMPGTMVVCRCNAPLVGHALSLIRQQRKVIVRGRDIGAGIIKLLKEAQKAIGAENVLQLVYGLNDWIAPKIARLNAANKEAQASALQDKADTLLVILQDCDDFACVENRCNTLFQDVTPDNCVVFSSIHKAKGLEADCVVWLYPQLNYYFMEKSTNPEVIQQERNIIYVAVTRAAKCLLMQEMPPRRKSE
jgi:superfamily I DNA/RNA helicase